MDPEASSASSRSKPSKRREVIASACSACQKRKSKCDGKRPVCSQCQKKGTDCQFDTDDLRRITNLRNLNQRLSEKVTDYEKLVTRLQSGDEDDAVDVLRQLRRAKDFAEGIERLRKEVLDASGSPIDEDRSGFGSPSGFSRDSEPGAGSFRGSTWHPALQIRITGLHQPASADYFGDDASPIASVRSQSSKGKQPSTASSVASDTSGRSGSTSAIALWGDPGSPSSRLYTDPHIELFGNFAMSGAPIPSGFFDIVQLQQSHRIPIHFVQSAVVWEDSPLSRFCTYFRDTARQSIANGSPLSEVLGSMDYVNVDLFFRDRQPQDPLCANFWACELTKSFQEFSLIVKLGGTVLLTHLMRWTIHPTPETYARVPDMMKPTPSQRVIPHPPAIDTVHFPALRDAIIFRFRDWITPLSQTLQLEWPFDLKACLEKDPRTGCTRITSKFEEFVQVPSHWSFGRDILRTFPELEGQVVLRDD